jgi:hypothetical protein
MPPARFLSACSLAGGMVCTVGRRSAAGSLPTTGLGADWPSAAMPLEGGRWPRAMTPRSAQSAQLRPHRGRLLRNVTIPPPPHQRVTGGNVPMACCRQLQRCSHHPTDPCSRWQARHRQPVPHHPTHPVNRTHPIDAAAIGSVALVRLARAVLVPCVALVLTVAGYRPAAATPAAQPAPAPVAGDWAGRPLDCLTVRELRLQARAAGHRALARSGRRADLLAALGLA